MSTALDTRPLNQVGSVKQLLNNDQARQQLAMVAANNLKPERMMRIMANVARSTPKILECEPLSLLGGLMQCASLGLEPNTVLGHAYLIPFRNNRKNVTEVQLIIGYKGLIDLARRSGHITSLSANIHYADDEMWEYEEGTESRLRHRPGAQKGEKLHAYAIAKFKDGGHAYVVLPWAKVMDIRDNSQGWQTAKRYNKTASSPWASHEDEMAKKTAIRALAKMLPLSIEMAQAVSVDETKADYKAFAMDPTQGVTLEGSINEEMDMSGDYLDEGPSEEEQEAERQRAEEEAAAKRKADADARKKSAAKPKAREKVDYTPKEDPAPEEDQQDAATPDSTFTREEIETAIGQMEEAFLDGATPGHARKAFEEQLEDAKRHFPDLYQRAETIISEYE